MPVTVVDRTTDPPTIREMTDDEAEAIAGACSKHDAPMDSPIKIVAHPSVAAFLGDSEIETISARVSDPLAWDGHGTMEAWEKARWRKKSLWRKFRGLFPPYGHSSMDTVCGIPVYGSNPPRWVEVIHDIRRWIDDHLYYPLHYRRARYDVVKTDLGLRYADVDRRMWFACFALLGEFVEKELGRETTEDRHEDCYRGYRLHSAGGTDEKAIDLWLWYLEQKARGFEPPDGIDWYDHESACDRKLDELMALRRSLWT